MDSKDRQSKRAGAVAVAPRHPSELSEAQLVTASYDPGGSSRTISGVRLMVGGAPVTERVKNLLTATAKF